MPIIMEDYLMEGNPLRLEKVIIQETIKALQDINGNNYEDTCHNLRLMVDVIEEIEEHINDEYIRFEYNPMGAWVRVEEGDE